MMWSRRTEAQVRKARRRRCLCCQELFQRDPRTRTQQKYCAQATCRAASKLASQHRWLQKPENQHYFSGPQHVCRVQAWRKAQIRARPLQEMRTMQAVDRPTESAALALQETRRRQAADAVEQNGALAGMGLQDSM